MSVRQLVAVLVAIGFGWTLSSQAADGPADKLGSKLENFSLSDIYGQPKQLADWSNRKAVVLAFVGAECPLARLYAPRLADLAKKYEAEGVAFVGISSNSQDNVTELKNFARVHGIEFPILKDLNQSLADRLGVVRLPIVYLLDSECVVRYVGRIDDQYGQQINPAGKRVSYQLPAARRHDLSVAIDELLAGKAVSVAHTDVSGCIVGRQKQPEATSDVTYSNQIVRLFNKHCVVCHREGQIGPFVLASYEDAAGWAEMINEVVQEQRMPPWHADPQYGHFVNDARLSEEEKSLIARWVAAGAPDGDRAQLPEPPKFAEGWMMPEPDQVIYMPKPFTVPAEGTVEYQSFIVDPGWTEDKWVKSMEPRPGTPAVVHHIVMYVIPPGGVSKYYSEGLPKTALDWFSSFSPGYRPWVLPEGTARFIPARSKLMFQMHYTPNGKEQTDLSYVGIKFADPKTVKREVAVQHAGEHNFRIPPHADNHQVESSYEFGQDSLLWSVSPHMHLRGKDFLYKLIYPDGKEETVLSVPQYDFGWQTTYTFAEPKRVPKGSKLHCIAHFDNSENNLNNPDPTKEVRYGPQTWEEMMYGWFEICLADQDISAELAKGPRDERERTKQFLNSQAAPGVDEGVGRAAAGATESDEKFAALVEALGKKLPQLDRLDITVLDGEQLRLVRVVELNGLRTGFRSTSTKLKAAGSLYADYVQGSQPVIHADLTTAKDALLGRMAARGVKSSVHVPLKLAGGQYLLNAWSSEPDAFGPEAVSVLSDLAARIAKQ